MHLAECLMQMSAHLWVCVKALVPLPILAGLGLGDGEPVRGRPVELAVGVGVDVGPGEGVPPGKLPAEGLQHGLAIVLVRDDVYHGVDEPGAPEDDVARHVEAGHVGVGWHGVQGHDQGGGHEANDKAHADKEPRAGDVVLPLFQVVLDNMVNVVLVNGISHLIPNGPDPSVDHEVAPRHDEAGQQEAHDHVELHR